MHTKTNSTKLLIALTIAGLGVIANSSVATANHPKESNSQSQPHREMTLGNVCSKQNDKTISVPISRASSGHVLVDGLFNSENTKTVIDTGGIGVGGVISEEFLVQTKQKFAGNQQIDVQGANHSRAMQFLNIDSAGVKDALVENMSFVVSSKNILPDDNIATLIGSKFLCNYLVEFDLQNNLLKLYPRDYTIDRVIGEDIEAWGAGTFTDIQNSGAVLFEMEIESKTIKTILDTGARHSIMNWKAAQQIGLTKNSPEIKTIKNTSNGVHGNAPEKSSVVQLSSLSFAHQSVQSKNVEMHISDLSAFKPIFGDAAALNLGIDFLNNRKLIIDYANKKLAITR